MVIVMHNQRVFKTFSWTTSIDFQN